VITLVLGGTRSGKSGVAERLAEQLAAAGSEGTVTYVATGYSSDPDMAERIAAHRARRPAHWQTLEAGPDLPEVLAAVEGIVLVDSLGTWVARHDDLRVDPAPLGKALTDRRGDTVVVSEEVGLSLHAPTSAGRQFTDTLGLVNQAVAAVADRVWLVVAGRVLPLDRLEAHLPNRGTGDGPP
jgi:adenosyl cobinamide kinase/adenosyl cobinamide phosphate guanylyltransferase